ncbi:anthrone oxygenase family protein [Leptothoe sp. PORK10 BA2]|uniref:anthrone oxygenase family protein n=1 Tax=Leptothoe sp. PORK10 BA2 TaxID=3110254 RepID=UPI002B1F4196|nr:anthrone oxygenase family protein [Leptothoe sp. PORK10 BA2]MEA5463811.1 anthrone oxygenase family protein [Leptothoe sp. PORK10 BA2]
MSTVASFQIVLILATLLCSLVAGLLFAFASVVMPGISQLNDREFIRAFQAIDGMIQNNQPVFIAVWVGSIVALLAAAGLGIGLLEGTQRLLLISAPLLYILGVQLSTFTINVPLNNQLQTLHVDKMGETALKAARLHFEPRWNQWNVNRTLLASLTSILLMVLLLQL